MPRIDDQIRDATIYLYASVADAEKGETYQREPINGGSGFLVWVKSTLNDEVGFVYAFTNWHVIDEAEMPVIRINNHDGSVKIIPLTAKDWTKHNESDLAMVCLESMVSAGSLQYRAIRSDMFINKEMIELLNIGLGDDVYMVGRFMHHAGIKQNVPSARSGIISNMPHPSEPIRISNDDSEPEDFLVEMRSLSGFSGSPVILTLPFAQGYLSLERNSIIEREGIEIGAWLLGIDRASFHMRDKVRELMPDGINLKKSASLFVDSHSGHAVVIPAWRLTEMINREDIAIARKEAERHSRD
jgi:Trypsin-like peptidase domain